MSQRKCPPGKILKVGYTRKAFNRRNSKTGSVIHVPKSHVPATCINDVGKKGKGPKILPIPDPNFRLSKYGYSVHKNDNARQKALRKASKNYGVLEVLRRVNLLRNYQAVPENKKIFSRDVEFMKKLYDPYRKRPRKNVRGGAEIQSKIEQREYCENGKCIIGNDVYESHKIDDKEVVYYSLKPGDVSDILNLSQECMEGVDFLKTDDDVLQNMKQGGYIGLKVDGVFRGFCSYKQKNVDEIEIISFCTVKGFGSTLYIFMEKFFKINGYSKIILNVFDWDSLDFGYTPQINFWYKRGFMSSFYLTKEL